MLRAMQPLRLVWRAEGRVDSVPLHPPARNLRFLDLPLLLRTMQPRQLVRALREHCAVLYAAMGRMG